MGTRKIFIPCFIFTCIVFESCSIFKSEFIKVNIGKSVELKSYEEIEEKVFYDSYFKDTLITLTINNISKNKIEIPYYTEIAFRQKIGEIPLKMGILNFYICFFDAYNNEIFPETGFISIRKVEDANTLEYDQDIKINSLKNENRCKSICLDKFESKKIELEFKFPSISFNKSYSIGSTYTTIKNIKYIELYYRFPKNYKEEGCETCGNSYKKFYGEIRSSKVPVILKPK